MVKNLLKQHKLSVTQQRITILEALMELKKPVTIEQLVQQLPQKIDTSTVYRTLATFVEKGLVYQTDFREGVAYFEFQGDHHHHHITCTSCHERQKLDWCLSKQFPRISSETGYTITNHMFEIFGLCENCSS